MVGLEIYRDEIKTKLATDARVGVDPSFCGAPNPTSLRRTQGLARRFYASPACLHFDERDGLSDTGDQVQFVAPAAPVSRQDDMPPFGQEPLGESLAGDPETTSLGARGVSRSCSSGGQPAKVAAAARAMPRPRALAIASRSVMSSSN